MAPGLVAMGLISGPPVLGSESCCKSFGNATPAVASTSGRGGNVGMVRSTRGLKIHCTGQQEGPSPEKKTVLVCTNKTCRKDGSLQTLQHFRDMAPPHVDVDSTGCIGKCGAGPNIAILPNELIVSHCNTAAHVARLLELRCGAGDADSNLKAAALKASATDAFEHGDPFKAEMLYTEALDVAPRSVVHAILANRSAARLALGNAQGALEDAQAAERAAPNWTGALMRQGEAYARLGHVDSAIAAYSKAATLDSSLLKKIRRKLNQMQLDKQSLQSSLRQ